MNNKISIIVPVYNVALYLPKCLDSLVSQTLKEIEIICVNDGATDESPQILEEYAKRDRRIKIVNRKNGGLSAARNTGLEYAKAKYVMFCDSDDTYEENMCEKMFTAISDNNSDIAVCGIKTVYLAHDEMRQSDNNYYRVKFVGRHYIDETIMRQTDTSVCNKIFKIDLIKKHHIDFPEKLNNEDYYFYNAYMSIAQTAYFLPQKLYNYIRHEDGSIMSDMFNKNAYSPDHLLVAKKLFSFYKDNNFLKNHTDLFWRQFSESFWFSYNHSDKTSRKKIQKIGNQFIDSKYSQYLPMDRKTQNEILNIKHNNLFSKIIRRSRAILIKIYKKINIAYRQQDLINQKIEQLEQQIYELIDLLEEE